MKTRLISFLFSMLGFVVCVGYLRAENTNTIKAREGEVLTLSGTLERVWAFGPPGYGEDPANDAMEHFIVLRLKHSLDIRSRDGDAVRGIKRVQLAYLARISPAWKAVNGLVGKNSVTITGEISLAINGHDHEAALIEVKTATESAAK